MSIEHFENEFCPENENGPEIPATTPGGDEAKGEQVPNMEDSKEKVVEKKDKYDPSKKEGYWQNFWEEERIYEFDPTQSGPLFVIDTPPPTISGALHMGHVFSYTQAEVIARFKRMAGYNVRYPQGFDNNGLPTERLAEKEMGIRGQETELKDFVESCLHITDKYGEIYRQLWKSVGLSVDTRLEYSTISPEVQKLAQTAFKELYERGIIYKSKAPAIYCTECHTSFAQAEKEDREEKAVFVDLVFKTEDGQDLIISTTRPELLPACSAVFINPQDGRFKHLVGKKASTPLGQEVTIISDEKVEIEKGSGAVMCCTYGDETDVYWARKYQLSERIILGEDGRITNVDELPEINGLKPAAARKVVIEKLREKGLIKKENNITHNVGVHERCGTPVEFLSTNQWFVKMLDMKDHLLQAGNKIHWYPPYMKKRYEEWVSSLKWDWCISRERFYGIPIPVYNCDNCEGVLIPEESDFPLDPKVEQPENNCPHCKTGKIVPERSVLDTWFTSSLTPDINNNNQLNGPLKGNLYPMSVRPMGHDIIRTWAVYSILMGLYRHGEAPWSDLMISGHLLLKKREKISKRTGGGAYKPEELIAKDSADAIRYAMFGAVLGKDAYFDEQEVGKGRKLVTKIYNAGRLVLSKIGDYDPQMEPAEENQKPFDRWIVQRSIETAREMQEAFDRYEYSRARQLFENFFWSDFCDNYLEIAKARLAISTDDQGASNERLSAQHAAYQCFLNVIKMASPFVPHITEEMYHAEITRRGDDEDVREFIDSQANQGYFYRHEGTASIHQTKWLQDAGRKLSNEIKDGAALALSIIAEARKAKTLAKIRFGANVEQLQINCPKNQHGILQPFMEDIASTMKAKKVVVVEGNEIGASIEI